MRQLLALLAVPLECPIVWADASQPRIKILETTGCRFSSFSVSVREFVRVEPI